jgi:caa(3)-type oxidase subunit IV
VKGLLVVMFFMHLKQATSLTKLFAAAGLVWLTIMLVFIMSDYVSRGWLPRPRWMR